MMLDVKKRVLEIVNDAEGRLDFEAVAGAFSKGVEKTIKAALEELAIRDIKKHRGGGPNNINTYERLPFPRRS